MDKTGGSGGGGAPTGCYKCGRPGHWSRDCPSTSTSDTNPAPLSNPVPNHSHNPPSYRQRPPLPPTQKAKQKAPRRTRPKLTPDLLLSDDGLGHILRYFPRAFKYRGRGREVNDLRHLLGMYADWHRHLLPYYNFDQFIHKVEQVGATKRVKLCLRELREKVADGEDPTKLHETQKASCYEQDDQEGQVQENTLQTEQINDLQEDIAENISKRATEEISQASYHETIDAGTSGRQEMPVQILDNNAGTSNQNQVSEEQRARMEANRLKALERAAARSRSLRT